MMRFVEYFDDSHRSLQWIVMEGGVEALSFERLAEACRERGMRVYGMREARLRAQWRRISTFCTSIQVFYTVQSV